MLRCLQLAKNGLGNTYPNPMVGSVVVHKDVIIGEGWHRQAGEPHAEVLAINSVKEKHLLKEATIYVSLEPCSHYGKTPPCSDLIIAKGIPKIVVGTVDPFAEVSGRGIKKLLDAGREVIVGVLDQECQELNKRFFTFHKKQRPYIILKWAQTADGFIAPTDETRKDQKPVWITNTTSRQLVHKWRAEEQAILVGTNTVIADNPSLTTREWAGNSPTRIILDRKRKISKDNAIFDGSTHTLLLTESDKNSSDSYSVEQIDFNKNVSEQICEVLFRNGLQSVIIEGGAKTLQSFIDNNLWDEARIFKGTTYFNEGVVAPKLKGECISKENILEDSLEIFKNITSYKKEL